MRYRYKGSNPALEGCEAIDLKIDRSSQFVVKGVAVVMGMLGPKRITPIFYTSWVGFLSDWIRFD